MGDHLLQFSNAAAAAAAAALKGPLNGKSRTGARSTWMGAKGKRKVGETIWRNWPIMFSDLELKLEI